MGLDARQIIDTVQKLSTANRPELDLPWILEMLLEGEIALQGLFPWSSNYTFLVSLSRQAPPEGSLPRQELLAVYKPCQGERPLWDFPEGTLCQREFASYLVSQILGWPRIPPVVFRDNGPHGAGSVQLFIDADFEAHYFTLRHLPAFTEAFRSMALFDFIVNNADRKGGHCLKDKDGKIWAIDHGLTFHTDRKLRTVIWEFSDEAIPPPLLKDLERLQSMLDETCVFYRVLAQVISPAEIRAFKKRIGVLLKTTSFPEWSLGHNVPYPPV
ncbi:MAG: SCO1664 family protein [Anaerolineae bacterium]|nr:SCO1664 family protein [Anaerolineae bacterium]